MGAGAETNRQVVATTTAAPLQPAPLRPTHLWHAGCGPPAGQVRPLVVARHKAQHAVAIQLDLREHGGLRQYGAAVRWGRQGLSRRSVSVREKRV